MRECVLQPAPTGARGWHIHSLNDAIGSGLGIMAPSFGTTYRQLDTDGIVEADSDQSGDTTQTMTVYGIDSDGNKANEDIELNGVTAVDGAVTFSYIENIWVDALSAGIMFLQENTGPQYIMEVEAGFLNSGIAQHFNGELESYITFFAGGLYDETKDAMYELRWYPDDSSCRGTSTGYEVLDRLYCPVESGHDNHPYPMPIGPLPSGGWLVVYAMADATSAKGWVTLQGFDD